MNTENNKLIAKFIGNDTEEYGKDVFVPKNLLPYRQADCFQGIFQFDELKFDKSWDWLMLVIEKIEENERFDVNILQYGTIIFDNQTEIVNNVANISFSNKIEHTYDAVVKFLEWYSKENLSENQILGQSTII